MKNILIYLSIILLFASCGKRETRKSTHKSPITNAGRYAIHQDRAPANTDFDVSAINPWNLADIKPEKPSKYGNHSPYVVFGKTYYLADADKNFEQTGLASWYGKKFHGHKTSNMEIFDMYKFTAAHRTLPLPSYVEVTNLDNNKKVIVRVNDRGPFKSKRIIDLSWAAARALEYDKKGLTKVHIRLIHPQDSQVVESKPNPTTDIPLVNTNLPEYKSKQTENGLKFLQIGAFSKKNKALNIAKEISKVVILPVHVTNTESINPLYRVRIGPLSDSENIIEIIQQVHRRGFSNTKMVVE